MNILSILLSFSSFLHTVSSMSCGIDNSPVSHVYEGLARIETYPWLGILYYPYNNKRFTTAVVLVTRQIVLGAASEIDKLPKADFRARARVVIGHNCSGPDIGVRDYNYHPDYNKDIFSALAMVQLETDHVRMELRPICPPPSHFQDQYFYAMVLSNNCKRSKVMIHKMNYVSPEECKSYYRRTGLDVDSLWPSHTACARSSRGGRCVWRSGAILVVKSENRWRLLGFGVYGPGCEAPARFLDYGMYHPWVQRSVEKIGSPAITRLASNHIVLRRTLSNLQRFGACDEEESIHQLFTEYTRIDYTGGTFRYNITLVHGVEYKCVIFKASNTKLKEKPEMRLRRWCAGGLPICFGFGFMEIQFYVELKFQLDVQFIVEAYGRPARVISPMEGLKFVNIKHGPPKLESYEETRLKFAALSNLQRFGACDEEESIHQLFTEYTRIDYTGGTFRYNITLVHGVEYKCVIFKASNTKLKEKPEMRLRRWCAGGLPICFGFGFMEIQFYVELKFQLDVQFIVEAYGRPARVISPMEGLKFVNIKHGPPKLESYEETRLKFAGEREYNDKTKFPYYSKSE